MPAPHLCLCQRGTRWRADRWIQAMDDPAVAAAIAANRFGLGARPGELARVASDARGWLSAQLAGVAPRPQGQELRGSADILSQALELRRERRATRSGGAEQNTDAVTV